MPHDDPLATLDEAALELEASRHGLARFARDLADAERAVAAARRRPLATRGGAPPAPPLPVARGRPLGRRGGAPPASPLPVGCPAEVQGRYQVVLHLERTFPPEHDQGCVVFAGCQLLEAELDRLLTAPLRPLAGALVDALRQEKGEGGPA